MHIIYNKGKKTMKNFLKTISYNRIQPAGLIVDNNMPFIAASLDGIIVS